MAYKALKNFIGLVNMKKGEVKDIDDRKIAEDLIARGFIEEVKSSQDGDGAEKPRKTKSKKSEEA